MIADLEADREVKHKGDIVVRKGMASREIHILQSGWAVMSSQSKSRGNYIHRTYLPGEIIGFSEIGSPSVTHQVRMQTDGTISSLPWEVFYQALHQYRRLAALFTALNSLELSALRNHHACMSTMDGSQNLKFFLLQLRCRQLVDGVGEGDRFLVPLSQVEIGQAIGMTSIYVNKLLRAFSASGDLEISRPHYRMLKRKAWELETEFSDTLGKIDTSWFPAAPEDIFSGQATGPVELRPEIDRAAGLNH